MGKWWTILLVLATTPVGADSEPTFSPSVYWHHGALVVGVADCTSADRLAGGGTETGEPDRGTIGLATMD